MCALQELLVTVVFPHFNTNCATNFLISYGEGNSQQTMLVCLFCITCISLHTV